ncbi:MAG: recombinase family protein [Oscillospiraceae bacterium]|nr:recombinase family protein [Oscillospiraceae bacterium]
MPDIIRIEPTVPILKQRKKVAAYARVSKETERLLHSLSTQVSYYSEHIQKNPEWEYVGVYADSFISGTKTENRPELQRLLADCEKGLVDIVLCKSISRLARNTVDLLCIVRHLKDLGIEVRFEKENIHSLSADGELMLTILASFSEQESRSISDNCKWGIRKRFASGTIGAANKHILGFRYDEETEQYMIIPEEAETVRWMFRMYLEGLSFQQIADELNAAGIRTTHGNAFQEGSVHALIFNEIYAGDLRRQKTYTLDPISKVKIKNHGELPQYLYTDCHEAIIDRETYAKVQAEMQRRKANLNLTYFFSGKIHCECCGNVYTRKKGKQRGKVYVHWICRSKKEKGMTCKGCNFREEELVRICTFVIGEDYEKRILNMRVDVSGDIWFRLTDGTEKVWKNLNLNPPKHPHTITDAFLGKIICGKCGNIYHRCNAKNRWTYWKCYGRQKKDTACDNVIFTDYQLRTISAHMLNLNEFDGKIFTDRIKHIEVLPNGSLKFTYQNGSEKLWQRV